MRSIAFFIIFISLVSYVSCGLYLYLFNNFHNGDGTGHNYYGSNYCYEYIGNVSFESAKTDIGVCFIYSGDCLDGCDICVDTDGLTDVHPIRKDINAQSVYCHAINGLKCGNYSCKYKNVNGVPIISATTGTSPPTATSPPTVTSPPTPTRPPTVTEPVVTVVINNTVVQCHKEGPIPHPTDPHRYMECEYLFGEWSIYTMSCATGYVWKQSEESCVPE